MIDAGFLPPAFGGRVVSIPIIFMGQYFRAVNKTKKEVVCPWCIGGGAKLWEWAACPIGALFVLLLRKSICSGGGDYYGYTPQVLDSNGLTPFEVQRMLAKIMSMEGKRIPTDPTSVVGRWAGDEVYLVGDYDSSGLYHESHDYRNISRELVESWNSFMDLEDRQLTYNPECVCGQVAAQRTSS
jgi:hypothetical protein